MHGKEKTVWIFQTVSEQRYRDSNPNIQSQSLLCYLYTIPLCVVLELSVGFARPLCSRRVLLYHNGFCLSTPFLKKVEKILDFFSGAKRQRRGRLYGFHLLDGQGGSQAFEILVFGVQDFPKTLLNQSRHPWDRSPTQLQKRRRPEAGTARSRRPWRRAPVGALPYSAAKAPQTGSGHCPQ